MQLVSFSNYNSLISVIKTCLRRSKSYGTSQTRKTVGKGRIIINTSVMFSSNIDTWETPYDFFVELDNEFNFDIDVCATAENTKCPVFYTKEQDGLSQVWHGTCWCNPPYGREVSKWVEKAYLSSIHGDATVVMLLPARTDTRWFHKYIYNKSEIRFIKGRLKFGGSKNSAPFPSMVVIFNKKNN